MSATPEILIVDDDERLRRALERALGLEGFQVRTAGGGREAVREIIRSRPDLVLLDITMPDVDGITVLEHLRGQGVDVPVCVLSARSEVEDRVRGLEAGADDYLIKPFAVSELKARINALLRRRDPGPPAPIALGTLRIEPAARRAWRGDRALELTRREFDLLQTLAEHPGQVLSRQRLLHDVWGYEVDVDTNVVDVFAGYLRRKLESGGEPRIIYTERGVGFRLDAG